MQVYISRNLAQESVFRQRLEAAGHSVIGKSMIRFEAVPITEIPSADWYFFYSRRGVRYFFESGIPFRGKHAAIGPGTAACIAAYGQPVDFTGNGHPQNTAQKFTTHVKVGERVCFVRARRSRISVQSLLPDPIQRCELIVYNNIKSPTEISPPEVLVFTSPLNFDAYLEVNRLSDEQLIFSIGKTTGTHIRERGYMLRGTAPEPNEESMARLILENANFGAGN